MENIFDITNTDSCLFDAFCRQTRRTIWTFLHNLAQQEDIYSIHFNIPKNHINDFKTFLVAIPKNMTNDMISNDQLKYDYFKVQDVNFVMKMSYK